MEMLIAEEQQLRRLVAELLLQYQKINVARLHLQEAVRMYREAREAEDRLHLQEAVRTYREAREAEGCKVKRPRRGTDQNSQ